MHEIVHGFIDYQWLGAQKIVHGCAWCIMNDGANTGMEKRQEETGIHWAQGLRTFIKYDRAMPCYGHAGTKFGDKKDVEKTDIYFVHLSAHYVRQTAHNIKINVLLSLYQVLI